MLSSTRWRPGHINPNHAHDGDYALVEKTLVPINHNLTDILAALKFHWNNHKPKNIFILEPQFFIIQFSKEVDLQFVYNEGPWPLFCQLLLLHRYQVGDDIQSLPFDSYHTWFRLQGMPFLRRNEADVRDLLHGYLLVHSIKPTKNQPVPPYGYTIQTTLPTAKCTPTGINIMVDDSVTIVRFIFLKLPPQYCVHCRRLGHTEDVCTDELL